MENKKTEHIAEGGKTMSSIEWLESEIGKLHALTIIEISLFQQAKQTEKEQIMEAYKQGIKDDDGYGGMLNNSEQYYNETYEQSTKTN